MELRCLRHRYLQTTQKPFSTTGDSNNANNALDWNPATMSQDHDAPITKQSHWYIVQIVPMMKTCSTRSNLRNQYLSDYCERNDKQKPLYTVNDVLYIKTSNTGPAFLHTLAHCTNITVNYCIAVGWIQIKFTCNYLMMQALIGDS